MPQLTPQNDGSRRRAARVLGVLAALLLIVAGAMALGKRDTVGDTDRFGTPSSTLPSSATTSTGGTALTEDLPDDEPGGIPANEHSLLAEVARTGGPQPVHLRIDSLGISAPIVPTGVDQATGLMEVPANVDEVAWYRYGPEPGQAGSSVLAAHVDLAGEGPGVFFELREIKPGDRIVVEFDDGTEQRFTVEARTTYLKDELPVEAVFRRQGMPVLTLITCGGAFDDSARRYDSNVVVYAVPSEPTTR